MTDFIQTLMAIDHGHPATQVVERYLASVKRVPDFRSKEIGVRRDEPDIWFFYYLIEDGVLEIRVTRNGTTYDRAVTDYITRPADVDVMLGGWVPGSSQPVFRPPS